MTAVNLPNDVYLLARIAAQVAGQDVSGWVADAIRASATEALQPAATATPLPAPERVAPGELAGSAYVNAVLPVALEVAVALGNALSRDSLVEALRHRQIPCGGRNRAAIYDAVKRHRAIQLRLVP